MAKVSFNKLNKIKSLPAISYALEDNNIEIKQYLPLQDKLNLIISVIDQSGNGEEGFFNIVKLDTFYRIEMVKAYTNITFTEKQLEDPTKIYDALVLNDIWAFIEDKIPTSECEYIWNNILELARQVTTYNNSALGIIQAIANIKDINIQEVQDLQNEVQHLQDIPFVREILPLMDKTK